MSYFKDNYNASNSIQNPAGELAQTLWISFLFLSGKREKTRKEDER